jgi:hypothetical protein
LALVLALGACQEAKHPDFVTPKLELSEMSQPRVVDGEIWEGRKYGSQLAARDYVERVIRVDGLKATYRNGEGCQWTRNTWSFAPTLSWRNCPSVSDGFQRITAVEGEIWPLQLGKRISYEWNGYDMTGRTWAGTRSCVVWDEVQIETITGNHKTYMVRCNDPWMHGVWYVSPDLRQVVMRRIYDKEGERITKWELSSTERPGIFADPR